LEVRQLGGAVELAFFRLLVPKAALGEPLHQGAAANASLILREDGAVLTYGDPTIREEGFRR
jgi:hypothetical protein